MKCALFFKHDSKYVGYKTPIKLLGNYYLTNKSLNE